MGTKGGSNRDSRIWKIARYSQTMDMMGISDQAAATSRPLRSLGGDIQPDFFQNGRFRAEEMEF